MPIVGCWVGKPPMWRMLPLANWHRVRTSPHGAPKFYHTISDGRLNINGVLTRPEPYRTGVMFGGERIDVV